MEQIRAHVEAREMERGGSEPPAERCVHGLEEHKCGLCGIGLSEPPAEPTPAEELLDWIGARMLADDRASALKRLEDFLAKLHASEDARRKAEEARDRLRVFHDEHCQSYAAKVAALRERLEKLEKAGTEAEALLTQFDAHDDLHDSGQAILRHLRAALAPEDVSKEGGK